MTALMAESIGPTRRVLEPADRAAEILFGLIMVLTFTGSLSVAEAGREDVRDMLIGALGCNLAWGVIDGILYLLGSVSERGKALTTFRALRATSDPGEARRRLSAAIPPVLASVLEPGELDSIHQRIVRLPEPPAGARIAKEDWLGAIGVLLIVFLSTLPVAIPFLLMRDIGPALRASNLVAIALLFLTGVMFGRVSGRNPWLVGFSMVILGAALVAMTIALGG